MKFLSLFRKRPTPSLAEKRTADANLRLERAVLEDCDKKLEAVQDHLRGATKVKHVRKAIDNRIKAINQEILW